MKKTDKSWLLSSLLLLLMFAGQVAAEIQASRWLQLDADSKERLRHLIQTDVETRSGFSTAEEDRLNTAMVEEERQKEISAYKAAIEAANSEFQRSKKRADDLTAQFQTASYDLEETQKNVDTIKAGIANIENSITRYQEDIKTQKNALTKWLKTTKQGEAIVAVIYTRGFMDSAHKLEQISDEASAPLMARHMGTCIQSFTKVTNDVLMDDFIRAVEEGSAKWNRDEPLRIVLSQGPKGTTYLRIKRYELYPFQAPEGKTHKTGASGAIKAALLTSAQDLDSFLSNSNYSPKKLDLGRVESMIQETNIANQQAEANQREQLISFRERITYLEQKIADVRKDKTALVPILNDKGAQLAKMTTDVELLRLKKESARLAFQNAQNVLQEKKRVHESIIIKTSLVTVKRSETPAEAAAETVIEELKDVLNDARMQHYSSTTNVTNGKLVAESEQRSISEAKILAVRSLAFINEGESIRVKMAFRVRTLLDAGDQSASSRIAAQASLTTSPTPSTPVPTAKPKAVAAPPKATAPPRAKKAEKAASSPKRATAEKTVLKAPSPPAAADAKLHLSGETTGFRFEIQKVSRSGNDLTFMVKATNTVDYTQYLLFYDESGGDMDIDSKSTISTKSDAPKGVTLVSYWQGRQKTPAIEAHRGVAIKPNTSLSVELQFRDALPGPGVISVMNLKPTIGYKTMLKFYRWWSAEVAFHDVRVP